MALVCSACFSQDFRKTVGILRITLRLAVTQTLIETAGTRISLTGDEEAKHYRCSAAWSLSHFLSSVLGAVCSVLCAVCSVQCAVCCVLCVPDVSAGVVECGRVAVTGAGATVWCGGLGWTDTTPTVHWHTALLLTHATLSTHYCTHPSLYTHTHSNGLQHLVTKYFAIKKS